MLGDNTRHSPKYLTYLTAVLGIKLHTNIILQNLKSLHMYPVARLVFNYSVTIFNKYCLSLNISFVL